MAGVINLSGAIRATVSQGSGHEGDESVVVGPAPVDTAASKAILIDGHPEVVRFDMHDDRHAVIGLGGDAGVGTRILFGAARRRERDGIVVRDVVVDGWHVEVELEAEDRAALRERARRAGAATVAGGPAELHAIIPGRIVAVSVVAGDEVVPGQQLLVLEAMKMQNELRAQREGVVERVAVAVGQAVEVGDLLLVIR